MSAEAGAPESVLELLEGARLRLTPQRLAIVRELVRRHHPTVAEVYWWKWRLR